MSWKHRAPRQLDELLAVIVGVDGIMCTVGMTPFSGGAPQVKKLITTLVLALPAKARWTPWGAMLASCTSQFTEDAAAIRGRTPMMVMIHNNI